MLGGAIKGLWTVMLVFVVYIYMSRSRWVGRWEFKSQSI
jgi:hypothetical protein